MYRSIDWIFASASSLAWMLFSSLGSAAEPDAVGIEFFEKEVRPILVQHCYECHADKKNKGSLRLDSRTGWSTGGDSGPAIVPGKPDESLLIQAIRYGGDFEMPPTGKLPPEKIKVLEQWVQMGAPDPRTGAATTKSTATIDLEAGRHHWSYRPLQPPPVPTVQNVAWPQNDIDRFILHRLESSNLLPAKDSSREVLVRRIYFDLHGMPPSPEEIDDFVTDSSPDAYERLVERLLASPRFGERWGRHWLDVARFAESLTLRGFVFKEAWRYRDYVVGSFNLDRPFDAFLQEQIAGDLLPAATAADRERQLIATTFLALGNTNLEEQDKKQLEMDVIDEQLDVISKGILAQTITCARCHDHKFDPIPQRDYYALAGILQNTKALEHANVSKWVEAPLPMEPIQESLIRDHEAAVAALQKQLAKAKQVVKLAAKQPAAPSPALVISAADLPGIVVHDTQAKRVGNWKESQFTKRYVGEGYIHDLNEDQGNKTLTFVPELPRDGKYEVRLAYSPADSRASSVSVTIFSAEGEKAVQVNETEAPPIDGRFVALGQFRFERAGQSFVIVSNEKADGYVTADAVQFLPVELITQSTPNLTSDKNQQSNAKSQLTTAEADLKRLEDEMKKLVAKAPYRPAAMTVLERPTIGNARINIRGVVHNLGEEVPRGFLQVAHDGTPLPMPANQSGRMELAKWISSSQNPLTARVMANRVWHALLGAGIVRTTDNFGLTGESPSHPELLDYLATRFVTHGWSMKDLVREVVLSRTYRQGTADPAVATRAIAVDPESRLIWQRTRRRLDAECIRDSMLTVSGELRLEMGGPTFKSDLAADYGFQHSGTRRSVYEPVFRNSLPEIFEAFDFADPSTVTGNRTVSTVAPQALFLMNHPFVLQQSQITAKQLVTGTMGDEARVDRLFRLALGRLPYSGEKQAAISFVTQSGSPGNTEETLKLWTHLCQSLFASIDFRYVE